MVERGEHNLEDPDECSLDEEDILIPVSLSKEL